MKNYINLHFEKQRINDDIRKEKKLLHQRFYSSNKRTFRILDILVTLIIVMNLGSVFITNVMIVKQTSEKYPTKPLKEKLDMGEVNPAQTVINDYQPHKEQKELFTTLVKQSILYGILIFAYVYYRRNTISEEGLTILVFIIVFYILLHGMVFMNDLGYYLGVRLFQ